MHAYFNTNNQLMYLNISTRDDTIAKIFIEIRGKYLLSIKTELGEDSD